jgi:DNA (cytosine-5)-methyltransferase 1
VFITPMLMSRRPWTVDLRAGTRIPAATPEWKASFIKKNRSFYESHRHAIDTWLASVGGLDHLPAPRRKLEWQAQGAGSLWDCLLQLRPSGIRAKRPTYVPALVAITQTSIVGPRRRRITPREAARLQGLPDWFEFPDQRDADTYKQMGNGVAVGAAYHVLREHVLADPDVPAHIRDSIAQAGPRPEVVRPSRGHAQSA